MTNNETSMTLEGDATIVIRRRFNAPALAVFRAWTDPEIVARWWAPAGLGVSMVSCEADVRPGGRFRYMIRNPDGEIIGFSGEYLQVTPASRLVYTQLFEPMAEAGTVLIDVGFFPAGEQTLVVSTETYPSAQARHIAVTSGMEEGMRQTMDQLEAMLPALAI